MMFIGLMEIDVRNRKTKNEIRKRQALTYLDLGEIYLAMKESSLASASFNKALELSPDLIAASLGIALADVEAHGLVGAAEKYMIRDKRIPDLAHALVRIGCRFMEHENYDKAMEAFKLAVKNGNHDWYAHHNMGTCLYNTGNLLEAITEYEKAAELNDSCPDTLQNLAHLYESFERTKEAIQTYKLILKKFHDVRVYSKLAALHTTREQYHQGIKMGQIAILLNPNDLIAYMALGYSYLQLKRYDEAKKWLRQASWLAPDQSPPYTLLATAYQETGDHETSEYFRK